MKKNLTVLLLAGLMCLLGASGVLAYNEAPMLRVKVAAGELPPVEERLPEEPKVVEPIEEIGQYGGTIHVFATDNLPWQDLGSSPERGSSWLLEVTKDATIIGDLAKGYKLSDDKKSLTLYLRKGVKWSDGYPFTADDIIFTYEDMHWNEEVAWWDPLQIERIKKIDDYTVRMEIDEPLPGIVLKLAFWPGSEWFTFFPKHYLKKWHIKYNPKADELAKEEGFDHWWQAFKYHYHWVPREDVNKPTLQPWVLKAYTTTYKVFERNPYFWEVDTAGNQLPYIDRIVSTIVDPEVYQLKVIAGEADIAIFGTTLENYPLYKENEETGDYRVIPIPGIAGTDVAFGINQNHPDPVIRKIYQEVRFRQALSLAINREEINDVVYFGLAVPRQATVLPTVSYYKKEWGEAYAQYDPDEANRLLDEIGLTEQDKDGFRIGPDGKSILLLLEFSTAGVFGVPTTVLELVKEYWEVVGLKVLLKPQAFSLYYERRNSSNHDIMVASKCGTETTIYLVQIMEDWGFGDVDFSWAHDWALRLRAENDIRAGGMTLEDFEGGVLPGEEPPQEIRELSEWARMVGKTEIGSKEYTELFQKVFDFHAKNLFIIGTVGMVPTITIAKNNIGNVREAYPPGSEVSLALYYDAEQLFFRQ